MSNILHSQERSDVLAHVSSNLRRLRTEAGLSQTALATASGISRRMIIAVESGDANISLSSLDKLGAAMGVGFVDLVRDPNRQPSAEINEITWRGAGAESKGILLGTVLAGHETQMWAWSLDGGDRYDAEPDPVGWFEMLFVTEGTLSLVIGGVETDYPVGTFAVYSSAQDYSYVNNQSQVVRFVRNVVSS